MPAALDAADRKLLLIAGAVLLLLLGAVAFETPPTEEIGESTPSTYYSAPGGARAAYLLLQALHYNVQRWERSPLELPADSAGSILILADPSEIPSAAERRALQRFVVSGGQVLFTGSQIESFFADAKLSDDEQPSESQTYTANIPSALTRGATTVSLRPEAAWANSGPPRWLSTAMRILPSS